MVGRFFTRWIMGGGIWLLAGCGGDAETGRVPLHGSVRVEGAPVIEGSLSLLPIEGHSGPAASTSIANGQYAFTKATGPVAGPYRAVVGVLATDTGANAAATEDRQPSDAAIKSPPTDAKRRSSQMPADFASPSQWELEFDVPSEGDYRADLDFGN